MVVVSLVLQTWPGSKR